MNLELKKYIEENLRSENFKLSSKRILSSHSRRETLDSQLSSYEEESLLKSNTNLGNFIKENSDYSDFQTMLFKMIDDRGLIDADVYNKVHIDRRLFSKIRNDKDYHPSKETVLLLGFALELSESEIEELLDSAAYSLPRNNNYDLIIRFCFMKGIYNLANINELLDEYGCKLFSY